MQEVEEPSEAVRISALALALESGGKVKVWYGNGQFGVLRLDESLLGKQCKLGFPIFECIVVDAVRGIVKGARVA